MKKCKVLVLGTNATQADLIRYLSKRGFTVFSCSNRTGEIGERLSDSFVLLDITDVDGVTKLAAREGVDFVYSVSSDIAMPTVAEVSSRLGLPNFYDPELIALLNAKPSLRRHLRDNGLGPIRFLDTRSLAGAEAWDVFPCVVKPSDMQGQRGVSKVHDQAELRQALSEVLAMSPSGSAIIEEFLPGVEISCNALVCDSQVVMDAFSERLVHEGSRIGIPRGHLIPTVSVSSEHLAQAARLVRDIVTSLGIRRGPLYFQMKVTGDGPRIVEIAPRLDGCHIWRLIKAAWNVDFMDLTLRCLQGETISRVESAQAPGVFELMFQQQVPGTPFHTADFPIPQDAIYHEYRYTEGDAVHAINGRFDVVGYYVRRRTE